MMGAIVGGFSPTIRAFLEFASSNSSNVVASCLVELLVVLTYFDSSMPPFTTIVIMDEFEACFVGIFVVDSIRIGFFVDSCLDKLLVLAFVNVGALIIVV